MLRAFLENIDTKIRKTTSEFIAMPMSISHLPLPIAALRYDCCVKKPVSEMKTMTDS